MKKWIISGLIVAAVVAIVVLIVCLFRNADPIRFASAGGYVFDKENYYCQQIDSVQKTEHWPRTEHQWETTVVTLEDGTPLTLSGLQKFEPGWYISDNTPTIAGPYETEAACHKVIDDQRGYVFWPDSYMK